PPNIDAARPTDPPSMGSVCTYLEKKQGPLPSYVFLPCPLGWGEYKKKPGPHGGFLGQRYDPLATECTAYIEHPTPNKITDMEVVLGEPRLAGAAFPEGTSVDYFLARRSLLQQLDDKARAAEKQP